MADSTWLIVGLGNPGAKYRDTRHNVGFMAIDALFQLLSKECNTFTNWNLQKNYEIATINFNGNKLVFLKPLQFMNLSGVAVQDIANFYKISSEKIIIIHDEADLDFSKIKIKKGGGDAGHNGLKSITSSIGTADYYRFRVGIGRPQGNMIKEAGIADWVLSRFTSDELASLDKVFVKITNSIKILLKEGLNNAQMILGKE